MISNTETNTVTNTTNQNTSANTIENTISNTVNENTNQLNEEANTVNNTVSNEVTGESNYIVEDLRNTVTSSTLINSNQSNPFFATTITGNAGQVEGYTYVPNAKYYLTEDEEANDETEFEIEFQTITVSSATLYNQEIISAVDGNEITVKGYMPMGCVLNLTTISNATAEGYIADRLCFLNDMTVRSLPKLEEKLEYLENKNNITYDEIQKKAIIKAVNNNLTIITGGPGTGKTTIIKAIVNLLTTICKVKENEIALLAPTGRASKKMMETTAMPAYTIHKYLGWDKEKNEFRIDEYHPNQEKYIIVDETSMIDTILMSSLLKGIRRDAKLILVGDYFQLPSVSQGQVLKDLIESEMLDVIKLNRLYRQNEDSYIINLAYEIKDKDLNEHFMNKKDDYNFIACANENVLSNINEIVNIAISRGFDDRTIQVLAPMYKTINGIDSLNQSLQLIFNPFDPGKNEITIGEVTYRENDKVLQLINDPDNNVFNGDIGYIVSIVNKNKTTEITIDYDGNFVTYSKDKFSNFRHGYAISIHKAQGSEFNMVIIPFVNSFKRMLYNKLVYTAVTRAKNKLILIGDPNSFIYGIKNDYIDNRKTTLKELIENKYNYKK